MGLGRVLRSKKNILCIYCTLIHGSSGSCSHLRTGHAKGGFRVELGAGREPTTTMLQQRAFVFGPVVGLLRSQGPWKDCASTKASSIPFFLLSLSYRKASSNGVVVQPAKL
jgi:hypothetical protein